MLAEEEEVDALEVDGAQVMLLLVGLVLVLVDEGDSCKSVFAEAELVLSHTVTFTGEQR